MEDLNDYSFDQWVWFCTTGDGRKTYGHGIHWTVYRAHKELIGYLSNWTSARDRMAIAFKRY